MAIVRLPSNFLLRLALYVCAWSCASAVQTQQTYRLDPLPSNDSSLPTPSWLSELHGHEVLQLLGDLPKLSQSEVSPKMAQGIQRLGNQLLTAAPGLPPNKSGVAQQLGENLLRVLENVTARVKPTDEHFSPLYDRFDYAYAAWGGLLDRNGFGCWFYDVYPMMCGRFDMRYGMKASRDCAACGGGGTINDCCTMPCPSDTPFHRHWCRRATCGPAGTECDPTNPFDVQTCCKEEADNFDLQAMQGTPRWHAYDGVGKAGGIPDMGIDVKGHPRRRRSNLNVHVDSSVQSSAAYPNQRYAGSRDTVLLELPVGPMFTITCQRYSKTAHDNGSVQYGTPFWAYWPESTDTGASFADGITIRLHARPHYEYDKQLFCGTMLLPMTIFQGKGAKYEYAVNLDALPYVYLNSGNLNEQQLLEADKKSKHQAMAAAQLKRSLVTSDETQESSRANDTRLQKTSTWMPYVPVLIKNRQFASLARVRHQSTSFGLQRYCTEDYSRMYEISSCKHARVKAACSPDTRYSNFQDRNMDSRTWRDPWGDSCGWWQRNDPGCKKYWDYGQHAHCPTTCGHAHYHWQDYELYQDVYFLSGDPIGKPHQTCFNVQLPRDINFDCRLLCENKYPRGEGFSLLQKSDKGSSSETRSWKNSDSEADAQKGETAIAAAGKGFVTDWWSMTSSLPLPYTQIVRTCVPIPWRRAKVEMTAYCFSENGDRSSEDFYYGRTVRPYYRGSDTHTCGDIWLGVPTKDSVSKGETYCNLQARDAKKDCRQIGKHWDETIELKWESGDDVDKACVDNVCWCGNKSVVGATGAQCRSHDTQVCRNDQKADCSTFLASATCPQYWTLKQTPSPSNIKCSYDVCGASDASTCCADQRPTCSTFTCPRKYSANPSAQQHVCKTMECTVEDDLDICCNVIVPIRNFELEFKTSKPHNGKAYAKIRTSEGDAGSYTLMWQGFVGLTWMPAVATHHYTAAKDSEPDVVCVKLEPNCYWFIKWVCNYVWTLDKVLVKNPSTGTLIGTAEGFHYYWSGANAVQCKDIAKAY